MAGRARVGDFELVGGRRRDELERMAADVYVGEGLFNLRHMAVDALVAGGAGLVVGVLLQGRGVGSVRGVRAVAGEADGGLGFDEIGSIGAAVRVVATGAGDAVGVHRALDEVVALHPVLVAGAIGKVGEGCFPGLVFFELPEVT